MAIGETHRCASGDHRRTCLLAKVLERVRVSRTSENSSVCEVRACNAGGEVRPLGERKRSSPAGSAQRAAA